MPVETAGVSDDEYRDQVRRVSARGAAADPARVAKRFDPDRLTLARERAGWTRRELATRLAVPTSRVREWEQGSRGPGADDVVGFATALGMPVWYFNGRRWPGFATRVSDDAAFFRKARVTRQYERRQALTVASHIADIVLLLETTVRLPRLNLPRLPADVVEPAERPIAAAELIRQEWGIGEKPLWHLIRHMENKGIVLSMARFGAAERIDAFACEPPGLGRPVVSLALDRTDPIKRRFNAAHELGHLVMHTGLDRSEVGLEAEADQFAMELLLPRFLREELPFRDVFWDARALQEVWGVSLLNIFLRARDLGMMRQKMYERCVRKWKRLRYGRHEPVGGDYEGEWPTMLAAAVEFRPDMGLSTPNVAAILGLPHSDVLELLSLEPVQQPHLRLVPECMCTRE